jgi:hypothetical protein
MDYSEHDYNQIKRERDRLGRDRDRLRAVIVRMKALLEKNDGRNDMSNGSEADEAYLRGRESAMADVRRVLEG